MALHHLNTNSSRENSPGIGWNKSIQDRELAFLHCMQSHSQQFPHITNFQQSPYNISPIDKNTVDIYENPSEHYAAINYNGPLVNNQSLHPGMIYGGKSSFQSHPRQPSCSSDERGERLVVNGYSYGKFLHCSTAPCCALVPVYHLVSQ